MGQATRDQLLGDVIVADAMANSDVELATVIHSAEGKPSPAVIRRGEGANARILFRRNLGDKNLPVRDLSNPAEIAEILSPRSFPRSSSNSGSRVTQTAFSLTQACPPG